MHGGRQNLDQSALCRAAGADRCRARHGAQPRDAACDPAAQPEGIRGSHAARSRLAWPALLGAGTRGGPRRALDGTAGSARQGAGSRGRPGRPGDGLARRLGRKRPGRFLPQAGTRQQRGQSRQRQPPGAIAALAGGAQPGRAARRRRCRRIALIAAPFLLHAPRARSPSAFAVRTIFLPACNFLRPNGYST